MINLLEELETVLKKYKLTFKSIKCIMNSVGYIPVADFVEKARMVNYDPNNGPVHIDPTLKVTGVHWWIERRVIVVKGIKISEEWHMCQKPKQPTLPAYDYVLTYKKGD